MAKIIQGKILKLSMPKTAVVEVVYKKPHPLYKKIQKKIVKYKAHYEDLDLKVGDTVKIKEVKPISKTKHWIVLKELNS